QARAARARALRPRRRRRPRLRRLARRASRPGGGHRPRTRPGRPTHRPHGLAPRGGERARSRARPGGRSRSRAARPTRGAGAAAPRGRRLGEPPVSGAGPRRSGGSRRRFRRRTVRLLVDFVAGARVRCEYATTLGAGRLFVEGGAALPGRRAIRVRFGLPGAEPLHEIEGRVAWCQPATADATRAPGMGVEFTDAVAISALARELEKNEG